MVDTTAPILSIIGDQNITHEAGLSYTDANATWSDHVDGSGLVTSSGSVDSNTPGTYVLSYNYTDTNGNVASTVTRTVTVVDTTAPILSIIGDQNITHEAGLVYSDANATWSDHVDGNGIIASSESVDSNTLGTYVLSYNYTDSNGNAASTVTRTVTVVDTTAPCAYDNRRSKYYSRSWTCVLGRQCHLERSCRWEWNYRIQRKRG